MSRKILVGSSVFFNEIEGFQPKDRDYVILVEKPVGYDFVRQTSSGKECLFEWRRMLPAQFVEYSLHRGPAMQIGKFLVPEFVQEIGFTIEHLKKLKPLAEKLKGDTTDRLFEALLRERYSRDQEIEVLRSRDSDADSYRVYQDYVTECKAAVDSIFTVEEVCDCEDCDCEVKEEVCDCEATDVVAKEDTPVEAVIEDKKESE